MIGGGVKNLRGRACTGIKFHYLCVEIEFIILSKSKCGQEALSSQQNRTWFLIQYPTYLNFAEISTISVTSLPVLTSSAHSLLINGIVGATSPNTTVTLPPCALLEEAQWIIGAQWI